MCNRVGLSGLFFVFIVIPAFGGTQDSRILRDQSLAVWMSQANLIQRGEDG